MTDITRRGLSDINGSSPPERAHGYVSMEDMAGYQQFRNTAPQMERPLSTYGDRSNVAAGSECLSNGGKHLPDLQLDCVKDLHQRNSHTRGSETQRFEHELSRQRQDAEMKELREYNDRVDHIAEGSVAQASETMGAKIVEGAAMGRDTVDVYTLPEFDRQPMQNQVLDTRRPRGWVNDSPLPVVDFDQYGNCQGNEYANRLHTIWSAGVECKRQIAVQSGDTKTLESIEADIDPSYVRPLRAAEKEMWDDLQARGLQPHFVQRGDNSRHIYVNIP